MIDSQSSMKYEQIDVIFEKLLKSIDNRLLHSCKKFVPIEVISHVAGIVNDFMFAHLDKK